MSRGHVQGFDSNAAQFERMGNPWVSERDRREMPVGGGSRKVKRAAPKIGKFPKVAEPVEAPIGDADRSRSPGFAELQRRRLFLQTFKSGLPGGTMTVAPRVDAPEAATRLFKPVQQEKLDPLSDAALRAEREKLAARAAAARAEADRINRLRVERFAAAMADALAD